MARPGVSAQGRRRDLQVRGLRICAELDGEVAAFRSRSPAHTSFPYLFVDATYLKARVGGRLVSRAVVTADGGREVLGLDVGDSEDGPFWTAFLRGLKTHGLAGVQLVISDAHTGLKQTTGAVMAGASWQRSSVQTPGRRRVPPATFTAGKDLGSVNFEVQRAYLSPRWWRTWNWPVGAVLRAPR